jgi:hypothetical protein
MRGYPNQPQQKPKAKISDLFWFKPFSPQVARFLLVHLIVVGVIVLQGIVTHKPEAFILVALCILSGIFSPLAALSIGLGANALVMYQASYAQFGGIVLVAGGVVILIIEVIYFQRHGYRMGSKKEQ